MLRHERLHHARYAAAKRARAVATHACKHAARAHHHVDANLIIPRTESLVATLHARLRGSHRGDDDALLLRALVDRWRWWRRHRATGALPLVRRLDHRELGLRESRRLYPCIDAANLGNEVPL